MDLSSVSLPSSLSIMGSSDLHFFEETTTPSTIRSNLTSMDKSEVVKGLKWSLAMISKGRNVSSFFPSVVKCVASRDVEVRTEFKKWRVDGATGVHRLALY